MKRVLSLGGGVQSSCLLLRSLTEHEGLPRIDVAVFADTQWEPASVYKTIDVLRAIAERYGVPVVRVTAGSLRAVVLKAKGGGSDGRFVSIPLHQLYEGRKSISRRQCTREFKIAPIERYIRREVLGLAHGERAGSDVLVEQWFGISFDERQRSRLSPHKWSRFEYPLIGPPISTFGRPWSRMMCQAYLRENWPDVPVARSACIGCPYHTNAEWLAIKAKPEEWDDACAVDDTLRHQQGLAATAYLHRSMRPLRDLTDADLSADPLQQVIGWVEECDGMCGT